MLEELPLSVGSVARELREERAALASEPGNLALALKLAARYIELGRAESDPRFLGWAEGVLEPWTALAEPPVSVLLLRATLRQNRHEFAAAEADLARVLAREPRNAQAWLTLSAVRLVQGDAVAAERACLPLLRLADPLAAASCLADAGGARGKGERSLALLQEALRTADASAPALRLFALTSLAELAAQLGRDEIAEPAFHAALALGRRDAYLLAACADFLLERGRAREVIALLAGETRADGLLLRLALAEQALGAPELAGHVAALRARFAASRARGDGLHLRRGGALRARRSTAPPPRRSRSPRANFAVQQEPRDARVLLEAALAAGEPAAARPALDCLAATRPRRRRARAARGPLRGAAMKRVALLLLVALWPAAALAHKPSDSYLALRVEGDRVTGQWDVALRDLDFALGLDADGDGRITWGELRARAAAIDAYALARLALAADGAPCALRPLEQLVDRHTDGAYAVLRFAAVCPHAVRELALDYRLFAALDPQHRGLVRIRSTGTRRRRCSAARIAASASRWRGVRPRSFLSYAREGVAHIAVGFDHLLFLVSLLLPAVLRARGGALGARRRASARALDVARIVTAFTVAHSLTLSLAALGLVRLPSRFVESAIALSVVLAALNNLWPLVDGRRWVVAFGFGLLHGFGFASVLADLGLPPGALVAGAARLQRSASSWASSPSWRPSCRWPSRRGGAGRTGASRSVSARSASPPSRWSGWCSGASGSRSSEARARDGRAGTRPWRRRAPPAAGTKRCVRARGVEAGDRERLA